MKRPIKYILSAGIVAASVLAFESCSKKNDALPQIDGYNSSDDVAKTNLVAYWSFDSNNNETISNTAPSSASGTSSTTGVKGNALSVAGGVLVYPTITAFSSANSLSSTSVSLWVNIKSTGHGTQATNLFGITEAQATQSDWNTGPCNLYVETATFLEGSDSLALHADFTSYGTNGPFIGQDNINNYGVAGTDYQYVTGGGKWLHYVAIYDGSASTVTIYANNVLVSNKKFAFRYHTVGADTTKVGNGPLVVTPPSQAIIGGWANSANGFTKATVGSFQGPMNGMIDEIRVYNTALTAAEIGGLYALGQAGR